MSKDIIYREDAIKEIKAWFNIIELNPDILIDNINSVHAAEPKQGEWMANGCIGTFKIWDCSNCGIHMETRWNYCPNCGAKMKGADDA